MKIKGMYNSKMRSEAKIVNNIYDINYYRYLINAIEFLRFQKDVEKLLDKIKKLENGEIEIYECGTEIFEYNIYKDRVEFEPMFFEEWGYWSCSTEEFKRALLGWKEFLELKSKRGNYAKVKIKSYNLDDKICSMYFKYYYYTNEKIEIEMDFDDSNIIGYNKYLLEILNILDILEIKKILNIIDKLNNGKIKEYYYNRKLFFCIFNKNRILFIPNEYEGWKEWSFPLDIFVKILMKWREFLELPKSETTCIEIEIDDLF